MEDNEALTRSRQDAIWELCSLKANNLLYNMGMGSQWAILCSHLAWNLDSICHTWPSLSWKYLLSASTTDTGGSSHRLLLLSLLCRLASGTFKSISAPGIYLWSSSVCLLRPSYSINCVPPKFLHWDPDPPVPQNVTLLGNKVFKEVTKLKGGHQGGP